MCWDQASAPVSMAHKISLCVMQMVHVWLVCKTTPTLWVVGIKKSMLLGSCKLKKCWQKRGEWFVQMGKRWELMRRTLIDCTLGLKHTHTHLVASPRTLADAAVGSVKWMNNERPRLVEHWEEKFLQGEREHCEPASTRKNGQKGGRTGKVFVGD